MSIPALKLEPDHPTNILTDVAWPAKLIVAQTHSASLVESGNLTDLDQVEVLDKQIINFQHINNNPIFIQKSYNKHGQNIVVLGFHEKVLV